MNPENPRRVDEAAPRSRRRPRKEQYEPQAYRFADSATRVVLFGMVVFSPWAFGGWPAWSVWTMTAAGGVLWLLLAAKCWIRLRERYEPPRWVDDRGRWCTRALAILTFLLLGWCFVSAWNARAVVDLETLQLELTSSHISWLPHSFDRPRSWFAFFSYFGLAGVFWAARDWFTTQSFRERDHGLGDAPSRGLSALTSTSGANHERTQAGLYVPERLRQLLALLCLNGGMVALVGILSALDNPSKVMWLLPHETRQSSFFGPFWYKHNGAHYLNLLFPVALGLWHVSFLRLRNLRDWIARAGKSYEVLLFPCTALMAASPFIMASRGGSLIAVALTLVSLGTVLSTVPKRLAWRLVPALALAAGVAFGLTLGWTPLKTRFLRGFVCFETQLAGGLKEFTLRCVFEAPSVWKEPSVTLAGLSDSRQACGGTPRSVSVCLLKNGRLDIQCMGERRGEMLSFVLTNSTLATPRRLVELVLVQAGATPRIYLNGQLQSYVTVTNKAGFSWPKAFASEYVWIGRGYGGSNIYLERIETVTLLDRPLSASALAVAWEAAPVREGQPPISAERYWIELDPPPILHVAPQVFSPRTWIAEGFSGRTRFFRDARLMLEHYPWLFGCGPGTFGDLYKVFLQDANATDEWYVHNDFLETRLTFGWLGTALVYGALGLSVLPLALPGGVRLPRVLTVLICAGLIGSLAHARLDWVFQTHSVLFVGVLFCCVLSATSARGSS